MPNFKQKAPCAGPGITPNGEADPHTACPNEVNVTRPSKTGLHFCQRPACRLARSREYQRVRDGRDKVIFRNWELLFIHDLAVKTRIPCPSCGLVNAIPGWGHRNSQGGPCGALITIERKLKAEVIDAVWPDGHREYKPVA